MVGSDLLNRLVLEVDVVTNAVGLYHGGADRGSARCLPDWAAAQNSPGRPG